MCPEVPTGAAQAVPIPGMLISSVSCSYAVSSYSFAGNELDMLNLLACVRINSTRGPSRQGKALARLLLQGAPFARVPACSTLNIKHMTPHQKGTGTRYPYNLSTTGGERRVGARVTRDCVQAGARRASKRAEGHGPADMFTRTFYNHWTSHACFHLRFKLW